MASRGDKPTIVIVQGSFQTPLVYEPLAKALESRGFPTGHPQLPSCTNPDSPDFPKTTLADDALAIRNHLTQLIETEHKYVAVAMQSYGGIAGSEAVPESLTYSTRDSQGLPGGVIHLFYYAAMLLEEGQSMLSAFGDSPLNKIEPDGRGYFLNAAEVIYNDPPEAEAQMWEERLLPAPYEIQKTKTTTAAWKHVESTYLICENDQAVPVQFQEMFAGMAKSRVVRCSAGHSPMLSQTSVLADEIAEAAERAIEKLN